MTRENDRPTERSSVTTDTKICGMCGENKSTDDFYVNRIRVDGSTAYTTYCKECQRDRARAKPRKAHHKYNLSDNQHTALLEFQDEACALCGTKEVKLVVDHDHDTGWVRGLLCPHCNQGLGHFRDNKQALEAALLYLDVPTFNRCVMVGLCPPGPERIYIINGKQFRTHWSTNVKPIKT